MVGFFLLGRNLLRKEKEKKMSDQVVLCVDQLMRSEAVQEEGGGVVVNVAYGSGENEAGPSGSAVDDEMGEEEPLIQVGECRICQEEDSVTNLEIPCACSGSLKVYLHNNHP